MCSLSWISRGDDLLVFFSRDEMRTRGRASPPQAIKGEQQAFIMPIDADAGGSWLSVNQSGVFIGLLNDYSVHCKPVIETPNPVVSQPKPRRSRGQIILELAEINNLESVNRYFLMQDLNIFEPFNFIYISRQEQQLFRWDGHQLASQVLPFFMTSSSCSERAVRQYRQAHYSKVKPTTRNQLLQLHQHHHPIDNALSLCMHRSDARTVSLSEITITSERITVGYWDGSPCQALALAPVSINSVSQQQNTRVSNQ